MRLNLLNRKKDMKADNTLTVLLPAYNAGPYLREAIDSILAQTWTDYEFLIINDGSRDGSKEIIESYNDFRIKAIHQENKGLITTLNEGILAAKGNIIARMDADDVCLPDRLQQQMDFILRNQNYVMVGSEAKLIDRDGNYLAPLIPVGHTHEEIISKIDKKNPFIHSCVMFTKDAVIKAGLYPDNALDFEDYLLWKKMLSVGKICNLRRVLLKVRLNPESITIDKRWRSRDFLAIKKRSIVNGFVSDEDAATLKTLMSIQPSKQYKQASYYAMVAKKYLWGNPNSGLARQNLQKAIKYYPKNITSYFLYLFSFLPAPARKTLYRLLK